MAVCPLLVERERELAFLGRVATAAATGSAQVVLVTGDAGSGKSRLAEELVADLGPGWRVERLVVESGVVMPARGPAGRTRTATDWVASLTAPVDTGTAGVSPGVAPTSLAPTVAIIEDAERLDPSGIAGLGLALDEPVGSRPVLVIAQVRLGVHPPGGELAGAVAALLRDARVHEVNVGPLSRGGLARMATALGHDLDEAAIAALHARTGGNAFFSEEVLLAAGDTLPWTVTDAVMRGLVGLPPSGRTAAEVLAVAVDPVRRETVDAVAVAIASAVTGAVAGAPVDGAAALVDAGLARQDDRGWLALRHALVGEVVAARLTGSQRRRLDEELAVALERDDVAAERLARHWRDAGDPARAAHHATAAARQAAASGAHRTATDLYRVALEVTPDDPIERAEAFEAAATAAGWAGQGQEAIEWATAADAAFRSAGADERAVTLWHAPGLSHIPKPSLDHRLLRVDGVEGLVEESRVAARAGDRERSAQLARQALDIIELSGDEPGAAWLVPVARRFIGSGHLAEGERLLQRARGLATASGDRALLATAIGGQSSTALARGLLDECLALDRQAAAAARSGAEAAAWTFDSGIATVLALRGDLGEASAAVDALLAMDTAIVTEFAQASACLIDIERARLDRAARRLDRLAAVTLLQVDEFTAVVLLARARWQLASGDGSGAIATLAEAEAVTGDLFESTRVARLVLEGRAGAAAGDDAVIGRVADRLGELASLDPGPGIDAPVTWVAGLVDDRGGRPGEAVTRFEYAAGGWEQVGWYAMAADAWVDAAGAAAVSGDLDAFARTRARAVALAEPRAMTRTLGRLEAVAPPDAAASPLGPAALTAREREIAELVAAGRTNREIAATLFLSEHTVRNRLVGIFEKLGVSRRAELAVRVTTPATRSTPPDARPSRSAGPGPG